MPNDQVMSGLVEPQGRGEEPLYHFTRIYLLFLQGLFKQFPEGSYRWSDDEKLSEICITDQVPIPRDRIEQRPAIVAMRGPAQFGNTSLDQMRTVDAHTGMKERTDLVACTMSLNCIAKMGPEVQRIAWIIMSRIRGHKELLQRYGGFHKIGDDISMTPETPPGAMMQGEGDPEFVMVTVHSPFFFQWTERVTPADAIKVREIEAHIQSAMLPPAGVTTEGHVELSLALSPPTIRGRVINPPAIQGHLRAGVIQQTVKT
jgi:hypothetical protein